MQKPNISANKTDVFLKKNGSKFVEVLENRQTKKNYDLPIS